MANIRASASITLSTIRDISAVFRFYKLQASTATPPTKQTMILPASQGSAPTDSTGVPGSWTETEPAYTQGDTSTLYTVELTYYTDGTAEFSEVSVSSAYEAAKQAWIKAQAAHDLADTKAQKVMLGTCNTAGGTAAKVVVCEGFELYKGALIKVSFSTYNTVKGALTLNVNNTGAKTISVNGGTTTSSRPLFWGLASEILFQYTGSYYRVVGEPRCWFGQCHTDAATGKKIVNDASGVVVCNGTSICVSMDYENTATGPSLSVWASETTPIYFSRAGSVRPTVSNGLSWGSGTMQTFTYYNGGWYLGDAAAVGKALDASKVATNYLAQDNTGIMVYDGSENASQTPSTATSRNVFIDSNSVDIRDGMNVLASFGEEAVIGQEEDAHMKITSTTIEGITEEKNSLFEVDLHGGIYAQPMDLVSAIDEYVDMFSDAEYMGGGGTLNVPSVDTLNLTEYPEGQDVTVRGQIYAQFAFMTADVECTSQSSYEPTIVKSTESFLTVFTVIFQISKAIAADPGLSPTANIAIDPCTITFDIDGTNLDVSILTFIRNNRFDVEITAVNENIWDIGAKFDKITYDVTMRSSALTLGTKSGERAAFTGTIGVGLKAETPGQLSVGSFNETYTGTEELFSVGNGLGDSSRSTAFLITETGDEYIGLDVAIDEISGYASGRHADLYNGIVSGGYNDAFDLTQAHGSMLLANLQKLLAKAIAATPVGMIEMYGGYAPPDGWLMCDGSEVSRTEYAALFNVIGTEFGAGDGSETFNVPDLIDRMPIGIGNLYDLNAEGGHKDAIVPYHYHSVSAVSGAITGGSHSHTYEYKGDSASSLSGSNPSGTGAVMRRKDPTAQTGLSTAAATHTHNLPAHNTNYAGASGNMTNANLPPYRGVNFIIYTGVLMSEEE